MSLPEFRLRVTVEASLSLSEDPAKVKAAMLNVLGEAGYTLEEGSRLLKMAADDPRSIKKLHDQLRDRHVRSAARRLFNLGRQGNSTRVMINRQAAHAGVLALCSAPEESALGPIYLTIESRELDAVIQWLTAYEAG